MRDGRPSLEEFWVAFTRGSLAAEKRGRGVTAEGTHTEDMTVGRMSVF